MVNKYWFRKRKGLFAKSESLIGFDLGWGWTPISIEGWGITLLFIFILINFVTMKGIMGWIYFLSLFSLFIYIAYIKTEKGI